MKKTIQINIGKMVFNIDEDAYPVLKNYLDSIHKYFENFEGNQEITEDIEARIAEKFAKKNEVVGIEDVHQIIQSMGTVADFEAIKEEEDISKSKPLPAASLQESKTTESRIEGSKFYRDIRHKALGGVFAGLAYQFEFDVVWARILFIVLSMGFIDHGYSGTLVLAYVICWIVFPAKYDLEERKNVKKFYRNPDNKVLGGVASGLSQYLGIDLVIVRILFVVLAFVGLGIVTYIIFWIVAPNANTITQKMELKGQAVTIENIETSLKSNENNAIAQESSLATLLLFPFRMLGVVLKGLGGFLQPFATIIRFLAGLVLMCLGGAFSIATVIATGAFFGLVSNHPWIHGNKIFSIFSQDIPLFGGLFAFLVLFIPAISLIIFGFSLISKQNFGNRNFWLTTVALWFAGLVGLSILATNYSLNFREEAQFSDQSNFNLPAKTLYLTMAKGNDEMDIYDEEVSIATANSQELSVKKEYSASGTTTENALENAKNIVYEISQQDSVLIFAEHLNVKGNLKPRKQKVEATVLIPKGKKFKLNKEFAYQLLKNHWDLENDLGINLEDIEKYTLEMGDNDKIVCADCPKLSESEREALRNKDDNFAGSNVFSEKGSAHQLTKLQAFDKIEIGNAFIIEIKQGKGHQIEVFADSKELLNDIKIENANGGLIVDFKDPFKNHDGQVNLVITLENLNQIGLSGAAKAKIVGFKNQNILDVDLSGAASLALALNAAKLRVSESGASSVICKGQINELQLELSGASEFDGKGLKAKRAQVSANGGSSAELSDIKNLQKQLSGGSQINQH